ncbi:hypothetical protein KJ586_01825 [Patescibacteria group bacterium]|nr:hypothetical protein [Patescibacteria group bacterium]MBU4455232.1 hypothetical protein [Patescibacteria group bacterium]MCG2691003.1 hypothetical protein [Candidatus Parcubacteria bacterium]
MEQTIIEVEIRAEVLPQKYEKTKKNLDKIGKLSSHTKRLSVMFFGEIGSKKIDIRVRVTNGECEVVVKSGSFGSHDRIEISQKINQDQFIGMIKIFSQFGFNMKIGERETFNYTTQDGITISLVSADKIAYIELEKMSNKNKVEENRKQLLMFAKNLGLKILNSEKEFDELCNRLDINIDWPFHATDKDYIKLSKIYNHYIKNP